MAKKHRDPHRGGEQVPMFPPETSWRPPAELPDLRACEAIAVDLECLDEGLANNKGPGWAIGAGHVSGVAVAHPGGSLYAPLRHPDTECFQVDQVVRWLADHAAAGVRFVFHNAHYDIGWLRQMAPGVLKPGGFKIEDTNCQAVMLDENRLRYDLDTLCTEHGLPGKDETLLREAMSTYGFPSTGEDWKKNIGRLPGRYVGPYAEADASSTLGLWELQRKIIAAQDNDDLLARRGRWRPGVNEAYRLEMDIIPLVHEMRWKGVKVNRRRALANAEELERKRDELLHELGRRLGARVVIDDLAKQGWLVKHFDDQGIQYPHTRGTKRYPDGQPSFTAGSTGWMPKHPHWLPQMVVRAEKLHKAARDFLRVHIMSFAHNGRLHPSINQYKSEDGQGTRTHRFSYSDPPLQQMPKRDEEMLEAVRGCYEPEDGEIWCACDYPQQEYRLIVHFGEELDLPKAYEAGEKYRTDPDTDFHDMVTVMTNPRVDFAAIDKAEFKRLRKPAKDANFAKAFGAGVDKFALMINLPVEEARAIMKNYDEQMPFVSMLGRQAQRVAESRGYVRLIDGARLHHDAWEPNRRNWEAEQEYLRTPGNRGAAPCSFEEAEARLADPRHPWRGGRLKRAFTHKAGNELIQGSAARMTKTAMKHCWQAGLVPCLQVHDELDMSVPDEATGQRLAEIMSYAIRLRVPIIVKPEFGHTWGDAKHTWKELEEAA